MSMNEKMNQIEGLNRLLSVMCQDEALAVKVASDVVGSWDEETNLYEHFKKYLADH